MISKNSSFKDYLFLHKYTILTVSHTIHTLKRTLLKRPKIKTTQELYRLKE